MSAPPRHALSSPEKHGLRPVQELFGEIVPRRTKTLITGDWVLTSDDQLMVFWMINAQGKVRKVALRDWQHREAEYRAELEEQRRHFASGGTK